MGENVFEGGKGDARQGETNTMADVHKLFRKRYRQLSPEELALHDAIKDKADELAALIAQVKPAGKVMPALPVPGAPADEVARHRLAGLADNDAANVTLALRHLEDCVYRAVKALTA